MRQCRQLQPHLGDARCVHLTQHHALTLGEHAHHLAPGVDQLAVAPGAPAVRVRAALRRGEHITLVLDGACAQQQVPVRAAGGVGEGRGRDDEVARRLHQRAVELGETQVVAHRQTPTQRTGLQCHHLRAGLQHTAFVIALAPVVVGEEVHLVVARQRHAVGAVAAAGDEHARWVGAAQWQRAADEPDAELVRDAAQELLDRPFAGRFGDRQLVAVALSHQAEIFGQQRQLGTGFGGVLQELAGTAQVLRHVG